MPDHLPANVTTDLPTLDKLGVTLPANVDAKSIASKWLAAFESHVQSNDIDGIANLFVAESWWRDLLALTWNFRTFKGVDAIRQFLHDRLAQTKMSDFKLKDELLELQQPYPDLAWVHLMFDFETAVGKGLGIARLLPLPTGEWKAHVLFTNLEDLKGFPDKTGPLRSFESNHGLWQQQRMEEAEFANRDPSVLIIGGGHMGLNLAARLKMLEVPTLVVERNENIGDNWAKRYEGLCLHDPVWYDHLPYLPFPPNWPVYTPAVKLARWLRHYAEAMELNVWISTNVIKASQDANTKKWSVTVRRANGTERTLVVKYLVFATGPGADVPYFPKFDGMDKFKGQTLHSTQYHRALDYAGKKVVVIGSCTSAQDICIECYNHGIDVTMYQRGSTYIVSLPGSRLMFSRYTEGGLPAELADRLNASYPLCMNIPLAQRGTAKLAEYDKELISSLNRRGFRTNAGILNAGGLLLIPSSKGRLCIDVGGSRLIAEGKIKLKNDSLIASFTETGLKFENGSELPADVVIFATGLSDVEDTIRSICGSDIANRFGKVWGLNDEGENNGCWRDLNVENLWYMLGNLAGSRFHSKHVALQIKAREEGLYNGRYKLTA